jgi:serine/threonine-protein kinase RsbT
MTILDVAEIAIVNEQDIVVARKGIREAAVGVGFGLTDVTRIVTAASELSRNVYIYGGGGLVTWRVLLGDRQGLEIAFSDDGPGIEDLDKAMQPGYTSGRGMGMGMPGAKRLMDEMVVESAVGVGTTVTVRKWLLHRYE